MKIRFLVLPSNRIINLCGPESAPYGWTPNKIAKRKKKTEERIARNRHYAKLEESILKEGFRNPILITSGLFSEIYRKIDFNLNYNRLQKRVRPELLQNPEQLITCERNGGSRLYLAHKYNLDIPCIINDFTDQFPEAYEIKNIEKALTFYSDQPIISIAKEGLFVNAMQHVHMQ